MKKGRESRPFLRLLSRPTIGCRVYAFLKESEMTEGRKRSQRDYGMAFKLGVVAAVEKGEMTYKQAQQQYGIQGRSTVLVWLRKHGQQDWGKLAVGAEFTNSLQRYATCGELHGYQISTFPTARLVDCYIEWMSDDRFELGGRGVWEANADHPQRLERDGWLCEFDIEQRQLTKAEYRMP
jgi:hypothetical protein